MLCEARGKAMWITKSNNRDANDDVEDVIVVVTAMIRGGEEEVMVSGVVGGGVDDRRFFPKCRELTIILTSRRGIHFVYGT